METMQDLAMIAENLASASQAIAGSLLETAASLQRGEMPPLQELASQLAALGTSFRDLRHEVVAYAREKNRPEKAIEAEAALTLSDLALVLRTIEQDERDAAKMEYERLKEFALQILDDCQRLRHVDELDFPPLEACQLMAGQIKAQVCQCDWPLREPCVDEIVRDEHPIAALVRIARDGASLSDERWDQLRDRVTQQFGQALATAACRGKLHLLELSASAQDETAENSFDADVSEGPPEAGIANLAGVPLLEPINIEDPEKEERSTELPVTLQAEEVVPALVIDQNEPVAVILSSLEASGQAATTAADVNRMLWQVVAKGHIGLAYHLATQVCKEIEEPILPAWLLRATALGQSVRFPGGEIAQSLRQDFAEFGSACFQVGNGEWNHAIRLLSAAASLRAGLMAPDSGASAILYQLHFGSGLEQLFSYCAAVATFGDKNQPLDPAALREVQDASAWRGEVEALRREADSWYQRAPHMGIKYAPAAQLWRWWLQKDKLIWRILKPVRENNPSELQNALKLSSKWSNKGEIDRHVRFTDRSELGRRGGQEITANALIQIRRHTEEAIGFLRSWIELQKHSPNLGQSQRGDEIEELKATLRSLEVGVVGELKTVRAENSSIAISASAALCESTVIGIGRLFDPLVSIPIEEPNPQALLNTDLLRVPGIRVNEIGDPDWEESEAALTILERLASTPILSWSDAFAEHTRKKDHASTLRILEQLSTDRDPGCSHELLQQLHMQRDHDLKECIGTLGRDAADTRREVEKALNFGLITERDHTEMVANIQSVEESCDRVLDFVPKHAILEKIRCAIDARRTSQVEEARQRLAAEVPAKHPAYARIVEKLRSSDVLTAHAYMDMLRQNMELPGPPTEQDFLGDFFPDRVRRIEEFLEQFLRDSTYKNLAVQVKTRQTIGPVDMGPVTGAQAERAAAALEVWYQTKRGYTSGTSEDAVRELFGFLGFQGISVSPDSTKRGVWMSVRTVPLSQREQCTVPRFGSEAKGHYRVLCVWERPNEEDLVNEIGDSLSEPVIVVFFGRLTEQRRRNLARLCRERRRTFLVLDEILMVHLCGVAGARLPVFFGCAVPFTYMSVYVTSAGVVPPELFYGRKDARESILRPAGSCFIYGGRQLGKTALLRDVERQFHAPKDGRWAVWIDLKARGIGYDRPVDDIWPLLQEELARLDIVKRKGKSPDKLLDDVADFVGADSRRHILLLLDEADRFLDLDGRKDTGGEYLRAARLKGLMDRTHRRFKVVFAGLHNVQRTTTLANHPLAHYGTPICIGPLFDGGEWREARSLIETPFAALGYRFENPDLVTRILTQTNYYPSLIQLYGHQLSVHMLGQSATRADWRNGPPFSITARDVEDAYHSHDLRKAIRDRFTWTLQLDKRYEVVAYVIGYALAGSELTEKEKEQFVLQGFPLPWIQRQALAWWSNGFKGNYSEDSFRVLLDEMVGLGILRPIRGGYGLRSPNVLALMGTADELERKLLEEREPDAEYVPTVARGACSSSESWRRSPFAGFQEDNLMNRPNRVTVVLGVEAAALTDVRLRLNGLSSGAVIEPSNVIDVRSLDQLLTDVVREAKRDSQPAVIVVDSGSQFDAELVRHAIQSIHKRPSAPRVIFTVGPDALWQMLAVNLRSLDEMQELGANVISLLPWHDQVVRQWLDDCGFVLDAEGRKRISGVTGNWPLLLYDFYGRSNGDESHCRSHLDALEREVAGAKRLTWRKSFGLNGGPESRVIESLAVISPSTEEYLVDSVNEPGWADLVKITLEWGRRLNLLHFSDEGRWELDSTVQKLALEIAE